LASSLFTMTIYNLWMYDEKGTCIYYREWTRNKHTNMSSEEVSPNSIRSSTEI
jgi:hypothetical protein